MGRSDAALSTAARGDRRGWFALLFDLFKLRIGLVIGFTAVAGAVVAGPRLTAGQLLVLAAAVTLAAAAAGAFNQYVERDIDARMKRTRRRAFVTGKLAAGPLWLALVAAMLAAGIALAALAFNVVTALHTLLGALTYGVIYTVVLKRRTAWNIVIGGLAGSFAVLAGAAAAGAPAHAALPLVFALVLFLWTPPHFWSLAIAHRDDYAAAGVPMLPVVVGEARAARTVASAAVLLVAVSLAPLALGMGAIYGVAAIGGGAWLVAACLRLAREPGRREVAMRAFHASLVQLTLVLVGGILDVAWNA